MKCYPIFSNEDLDLAGFYWNPNQGGYARRILHKCRKGFKPKTVLAHRIVLERMVGRPLLRSEHADHINGIVLDNRRENLRLTNPSGNAQNKHLGPYRGTTLHKCGKWQALVALHQKSYYLGLFSDRQDAADAASKKRNELGFLDDKPQP